MTEKKYWYQGGEETGESITELDTIQILKNSGYGNIELMLSLIDKGKKVRTQFGELSFASPKKKGTSDKELGNILTNTLNKLTN